jgi:hypothetical protein
LPKETTSYVGAADGDFFRFFGSEKGVIDPKPPAKP